MPTEADEVELRFLCGVKPRLRVRRVHVVEIGAAVDEATVEPEGEEVVAHVVVEAHRGEVPRRRVAGTLQVGHAVQRRRGGGPRPQAQHPAQEPAPIGPAEPPQGETLAGLKGGIDVAVDVQIPP
jgi:hypothetical protein